MVLLYTIQDTNLLTLSSCDPLALPLVGSTVIQAFKPFLDSLQLNSTHITVGHRAPKKRILIQGGAGGLGCT